MCSVQGAEGCGDGRRQVLPVARQREGGGMWREVSGDGPGRKCQQHATRPRPTQEPAHGCYHMSSDAGASMPRCVSSAWSHAGSCKRRRLGSTGKYPSSRHAATGTSFRSSVSLRTISRPGWSWSTMEVCRRQFVRRVTSYTKLDGWTLPCMSLQICNAASEVASLYRCQAILTPVHLCSAGWRFVQCSEEGQGGCPLMEQTVRCVGCRCTTRSTKQHDWMAWLDSHQNPVPTAANVHTGLAVRAWAERSRWTSPVAWRFCTRTALPTWTSRLPMVRQSNAHCVPGNWPTMRHVIKDCNGRGVPLSLLQMLKMHRYCWRIIPRHRSVAGPLLDGEDLWCR